MRYSLPQDNETRGKAASRSAASSTLGETQGNRSRQTIGGHIMGTRRISPPQFIRQEILRLTITEFAAALHVSQPTVTEYEIRGRFPEAHHRAIMLLAKKRGKTIRPEWFKAVPWAPGVPRE